MTFLTGAGLPDKILELQRKALTPTVQMLRPYINKYLGGFADGGKSIDENYFTKDSEPEVTAASTSDISREVLGAGAVVLIDGIGKIDSVVVATLLEEKDGKCTVKYFDPETGQVTQLNDVAKSKIRPVAEG